MTSAIHPDVRALLAVSRAAGTRPFEAMSVGEARLAYAGRRSLQLPPDEVAAMRDLTVPGPGGPIPLRLYRALGTDGSEELPCLLFMHGGGWMLGDLDSHDGVCRRLANEAGCCVIAVDYRLAPEHPFPAAIEDSAAALRFVHAHAGELGVDPARIAVGGDSAGGNLAAALALMGRDGALPPSAGQVLLYPALDLAATEESYGPPTDGMTLTPATMRWFVDHYLPEPATRADPRVSPARAKSLAGTPPAVVLTCGHDPLGPEGRAYAARLEQEGVPVAALHLSDQTHGMLTMSRMIGAVSPTLAFVGAALREVWRTSLRPRA